MGTLLKYMFYIALFVVLYLVGKGIYQGNINEGTTVGEVMNIVENGAQQLETEGKQQIQQDVNQYEADPKQDLKI